MANTRMVRLMTTWDMASIAWSPGQKEKSIELADFLDRVAFIQQHDLRFVAGDFFLVHRCVGADDEEVADVCPAGGCAVQRDGPGAARCLDDVGRETLTVVDVVELDVFELC